MSYFGISDFSLISSNLSSTSDGMSDIYSLVSDYSQAKAVKSSINILNSSILSSKDSDESSEAQARLSSIMDSITEQASGVSSTMTTESGSSLLSDLAQEAADKMYEETTGTGTTINTIL